jgi:hypothetical protein
MRIFQINQKKKVVRETLHALNLAPDSGNSKRPTARRGLKNTEKQKPPLPHHSTSRADILLPSASIASHCLSNISMQESAHEGKGKNF